MPHYFSEEQESELNIRKIIDMLRGMRLEFYVGSGVFSKSRIDKGSRILIDNCIMKNNWKLLDLGCGYGVVGIALARAFPMSKIIMTDINKRAVMLSKKNLILNKIPKGQVRICQGNMYESIKEHDFDTILLNPPQTAGKKLCFEMLEQSKNFLRKGGILQIVARHNKGGSSFEKKMHDIFGNAESIHKEKGYRVYVSKKEVD